MLLSIRDDSFSTSIPLVAVNSKRSITCYLDVVISLLSSHYFEWFLIEVKYISLALRGIRIQDLLVSYRCSTTSATIAGPKHSLEDHKHRKPSDWIMGFKDWVYTLQTLIWRFHFFLQGLLINILQNSWLMRSTISNCHETFKLPIQIYGQKDNCSFPGTERAIVLVNCPSVGTWLRGPWFESSYLRTFSSTH